MAGKPPAKLFIDIGAFIALCDRNDAYHREAVALYTSLTKETSLFTTLLVVSETYTWLRYRVGYFAASLFLEVISETLSLANSSPSYIRMRRFVRVRKPFCTASATRTSPIVMPSVSPF